MSSILHSQTYNLTTYQQIGDGFNEDYIFDLLEEFVFGGINPVGGEYTDRFNGMYGLPAVTFICTMVSIGICTFQIITACFFQMWCVASSYSSGVKVTIDLSHANFWSVYVRISRLLAGMWDHPYHGPRLRKLLSEKFAASW
jgi:hypothetical protein